MEEIFKLTDNFRVTTPSQLTVFLETIQRGLKAASKNLCCMWGITESIMK